MKATCGGFESGRWNRVQVHRLWRLGWRFWMESLVLSLFFGGIIAMAIRLTGRELEVIVVALAAGVVKIATIISRAVDQ